MNPSLLINHNIFGFDLPYLNFIAKRAGTKLHLGRDGSEAKFGSNKYKSRFRVDGSMDIEYVNCKIFGREIVDTMFLSYKHDSATKKYESYGLKSIIKTEGLEKKDRQFYDAGLIRKNYKNPVEFEKIKQYAKDDSDDALALFDLMCPASFYFAQSISKPFQEIVSGATGSQLNNFMVRSYLQEGHSLPQKSEAEHVIGGISFAVPGIYRNVFKVDLKSCYPSQILRFKLFDKEKDPKGYFYQMVHYFTYERFEFKKKIKETGDKYYKDRDAASKIFINSAYGLMNTPGLLFNSPSIARKITTESREVINMALKWASGKDVNYWMHKFEEATGKVEATEDAV
jgi:DNA polymerase elongation subunit (family B)